MITKKEPDRINISKEAKTVIEKIDKKHYMNLDLEKGTSRMQLFMFAMALGIDATVATKLNAKVPGGFVLQSNIPSCDKALLYAKYIDEFSGEKGIEQCTNTGNVYSHSEEYANTGFKIIENYIKTTKDKDLVWELIAEMDKQYNDNVEVEI